MINRIQHEPMPKIQKMICDYIFADRHSRLSLSLSLSLSLFLSLSLSLSLSRSLFISHWKLTPTFFRAQNCVDEGRRDKSSF